MVADAPLNRPRRPFLTAYTPRTPKSRIVDPPNNGEQPDEVAVTGVDAANVEIQPNETAVATDEPDGTRQSRALYKSSRFKGYLILVLSSMVNYQAAYVSNNPSFFGEFFAIPSTSSQRAYAISVALVSIVVSSFICITHLDCFSPLKKYWILIFQPKSRIEAYILAALTIWWIVALWINTGVAGIAGNGKGQYNLYFSSWTCLFVCLWTMERWLVSCGYPALDTFLASWPNRAPGWIAIFFLSLASLLTILDLYFNWETVDVAFVQAQFEDVTQAQWEWLLFATSFTFIPSIGFVLVEIFRENKPGENKNTKPDWETIMEGIILLLLFFIWIPSVIIATTPGGAASLVGNAYFFLWSSTVFVVDTCVWWIHDWRRRALTIIDEQEKEYRKIQQQIYERSRLEVEIHAANAKKEEQHLSAMGDDDFSITSESMDGEPISDKVGT